MPVKKYNYDIKKIKEMRNRGFSMRKIARINGWCEIGIQEWVKRHYYELIDYKPKK